MRIAFLLVAAIAFWACTEPRQTNKGAGQGESQSDIKIKRNLEYLQAEPDTPNVDVKKDEAKRVGTITKEGSRSGAAEIADSAKTGKNDRKSSQASPATSKNRRQRGIK